MDPSWVPYCLLFITSFPSVPRWSGVAMAIVGKLRNWCLVSESAWETDWQTLVFHECMLVERIHGFPSNFVLFFSDSIGFVIFKMGAWPPNMEVGWRCFSPGLRVAWIFIEKKVTGELGLFTEGPPLLPPGVFEDWGGIKNEKHHGWGWIVCGDHRENAVNVKCQTMNPLILPLFS